MSSPPHIVHITTHLGRGGAAKNVLLSCIGLARNGFRVSLLSGPSSNGETKLIEEAICEGVQIVEIPHLGREVHPFRDYFALRKIRAALTRDRPSIVHTHQSKAGLLGRWAARGTGDLPVVHSPHGHVFYGYFPGWKTKIFEALERKGASWCDLLIGLTQKEIDDHLERGIGRQGQWRVIPSGVDLELVRGQAEKPSPVRESLHIAEDAFLFASLGRLEPVKGIVPFLEIFSLALRKVDNVHWVILGEGGEGSEIEAGIEKHDLAGKVHLVGWRDEPYSWLAACDALLLPSRNEGMGRSIVEALALGLPVFAADVGSVPEIINDPRLGQLFLWSDTKGAVEKLCGFIGEQPRFAEGAEERKRVASGYSLEVMIERTVSLYEELLSS